MTKKPTIASLQRELVLMTHRKEWPADSKARAELVKAAGGGI